MLKLLRETTMQYITEATKINNRGVSLLRDGCHEESIRFFRLAMETARKFFESDSQQATRVLEANSSFDLSTDRKSFEKASNEELNNTGSSKMDEDEDGITGSGVCDDLYIFSEGFEVCPQNQLYLEDAFTNANLVSSIIVFNTALAFHLSSLEGSTKAHEAKAERALSLYLRSRAILKDLGLSTFCSSNHSRVDLLIMSIYNNCAYIYYMASNYATMKISLDYLLKMCSTVMPTFQYTNRQESESLSWHRSAFILNATSLRSPEMAAAA